MYKARIIHNVSRQVSSTPFDTHDVDGELLGDKILSSLNYGSDIGSLANVEYDEDVVDDTSNHDDYHHDVDVLCEPSMDFFEIGEKFGEMVEAQAPPVAPPTPNEPNE